MKIVMDKRLRAITNEVNFAKVVADIGADHGKVSVEILIENRAEHVIASDISSKSIAKCSELAKTMGVSHKIECRVGNGLENFSKNDKIDTVIIAGMGGNETVSILEKAKWYDKKLILVPHQDANVVRKFLSSKAEIIKDYVVESGHKFYQTIVADLSSDNTYKYDDDELDYGKNMPPSDDYGAMLIYEKNKFEYIVSANNLQEGLPVDKLREIQKLCQK